MVSCEQYDHLEIACMYHYPVRLNLKDGGLAEGVASNLIVDDQRRECLVLAADDTSANIPLENVRVVEVLRDNPHFQSLILD